MRQSFQFSKTRKDAPKDEVAKNAQLLIRAGYIHKEMAGVYTYLPLGLRVLNTISNIVREEMNAIGGQEMLLSTLQDKQPWEKSGRWDDALVDNWFKTKLKNDTELGLGSTHEEPLTRLMIDHIRSWRDLPVYPYQIQTKFRNEARAKSGIMRGREFLMKDLYSFSRSDEEHNFFYEKAKSAYTNVYKRLGIGDRTYITYASGGSFSKYSHEFQTLTEAGEDTIHICGKCRVAVNEEIIGDQSACPICGNTDLVAKKAVEVGNIFSLGARFSDALGLTYRDESGKAANVIMGSYGIGVGRVMGTIVELLSDEKGIVWPENIAPMKVHLILISGKDDGAQKEADALYEKLQKAGVTVLYDDRDARAGEKFADADLLGLPYQVIVSEKNLAGGVFEVKNRATGAVEKMKEGDLLRKLA